MKVSILDLSYKFHDAIKAIDRNELVMITYQGKPKAKLVATGLEDDSTPLTVSHPFFGMSADDQLDTTLDDFRGGRFKNN